jgi:hypothetical protein
MGWFSHVSYLRLQSSHGTEISFAVVSQRCLWVDVKELVIATIEKRKL